MTPASYSDRHIGPDSKETAEMLSSVGYPTLAALIDAAVPEDIRTTTLTLGPALTEEEALRKLRSYAQQNVVLQSF